MLTDYYQVREWLESFIPQVYTKENLGLERIEYLLELLDNPQNKFKSIHVAGTSGKGSTAYYITRLLQQSGKGTTSGQSITSTTRSFLKARDTRGTFGARGTFRVGLHISPHLVDIRERMQILQNQKSNIKNQKFNERLMPMGKFLRLFNEIRPIVERIQKEKPELVPSYFEILVAATFKYFVQEKVDWAVVEVGLGGRLDATNVLMPEVSVITNVGLDHTEILGKTIEKIAFEKAGIIKESTRSTKGMKGTKRGIPVVTGASGRSLKVIEKVAREKKAPLIKVDTQLGVGPLKSDTKDYLINYYDILRHTPGNFVFSNALLAIETVKTLGFRLSKEVITKAVRSGLPGRFEEIDHNVILDGAHNPDKIRFLIDFVRKLKVKSEKLKVDGIILVVAFKKGKQWRKMVDLLIKNLPVKKVIATKFWSVTDMGKYQAVQPEEIARYVRSIRQGESLTGVYSNSQEAVFEALRLRSGSSTLILVTGSLYLVGEVRTMWKLPQV